MKINRSMITAGVLAILFIGIVLANSFINQPEKSPENEVSQEDFIEIGDIDEYEEDELEDFNEDLFIVNSEGNVAVGITFLNPIEDDENYFRFGVALNTHSVDLDAYDLSQRAVLFLENQLTISENIEWRLVEGEGHHVLGELKIPSEYEDKKISYVDYEYVELEIRDIDGIASRRFKWEKDLFL
ncbi:hypothetical protein [Clostridium formicaceticum]|uniref:Uncharacterized protein n=1 Tax=Clostridium formicaceticum TaxID=1497 RepID=A0AAC9WH15_9CLOT|nr:hypothetical protein [Clostridium formicaceticum]AOY77763.1 hypothetical protein BJL90_19000 [Clostridium formicaceticum]ARE88364.1 hypothetical protein CLFO_27660 [Clostridium formicaceticum]